MCSKLTIPKMLVDELARKTSAPYEILLWLNVADAALDAFLDERRARRVPIQVVGRAPDNMGVRAYRDLFRAARYPCRPRSTTTWWGVARNYRPRGPALRRVPRRQATGGGRVAGRVHDRRAAPAVAVPVRRRPRGLYEGPIDGWFSIYHRAILPVLLALPYAEYCCLGAMARHALGRRGLQGLLFDNHSDWSPLLEWYQGCPFEVPRLGPNLGQRAPWISGAVARVTVAHYVVTDPDLAMDGCPADVLEVLANGLAGTPGR